jgi:hypothetical protein
MCLTKNFDYQALLLSLSYFLFSLSSLSFFLFHLPSFFLSVCFISPPPLKLALSLNDGFFTFYVLSFFEQENQKQNNFVKNGRKGKITE